MKTVLTILALVLSQFSRTEVIKPQGVSDSASTGASISEPGTNPGARTVYLTAYSELDSCHYPKDRGCLTASGKLAQEGMIACPRDWKLGTQVQIGNQVYVCDDRYSRKLDDERDLPTIDIWAGSGRTAHYVATKFGIQKAEVIIK